MIIADTSVWIPYIRRESLPEVNEFRALLRSGQLAMTGMVLSEVLQGLRRGDDVEEYTTLLSRFPFLNAEKDDWLLAGRQSYSLRRQGLSIPLSDLVIGSVALRNGCAVLAKDQHFTHIAGLKLHQATS